jgi:chromosomal replication initiation ATPase DnaA
MGRPLLKPDCADTETVLYARAKRGSDDLLALLRQHHSRRIEAKDAVEVIPPKRKIWFEILEDKEIEAPQPKIEDIKRLVCRYFNLTMVDLISQRRNLETVRPRQIAMYLSKQFTDRSLPEIGRRFGNRDHTTALSAIRKVSELCRKDWIIAHDVAFMEAALS